MQADEKYRTGVEDMRYFFVRSNDGKSIPLNTLVSLLLRTALLL